MPIQDSTKFLKAVSDHSRQKIMAALRKEGELSVGVIREAVGLRQPTISQHLKVLSEAGVVRSRRKGQEVLYSLCNEVIYDVIAGFMKQFGASKNKK